MKLIFVALLILVVSVSVNSQNSKDDFKQDILDMQNEIKDIEAEIADAKINYPEDVPELQKELATSKKMLATFQKMAGMPSGPQPAVVKAVPTAKAAYNSPIVPINLNQPVKPPTPDQAKDRLLWYTGKKINDSTLVTTRAMVVQFQKSKNRVVSQPETKSDPFKHLVEELEKSEQRKDELIDEFIKMKNGTLYYPFLINSLKVYDDIEERYDKAAKNTIDVPDLGISKPNDSWFEDVPSRGPSIGDDYNITYSDELDDVVARIKAAEKRADELEAQLPPVDQFPAPPRKDIGICAFCDPKIVEREKLEDEKWHEEFMEKEAEIIRLRLGIERIKALLGMEGGEFANIMPLTNRMSIKVKLLQDRYGNNFEYAKTVIPLVLGFERQKQLLGIEDETGTSINMAGMLHFDYSKMLKEQMDLKNYNFALNMAQHLGLERQRQLLGVDDEIEPMKEFNMAMDFNRFAMTLDLDFIFEKVDDDDKLELKTTGTIYTKDKVYVRLYPDSCSWRMILFESDYRDANEQRVAIPLIVKSGSKTLRDNDDNLVTFDYSGPKDMVAFLPEFKIDLCDLSKKDSAFMMPINYTYGYVPKAFDLRKYYKEDMGAIANHMFVDINKVEENASEVMDIAAEIIDNVTQSQVTAPTGNVKLDKMQNEYNFKLKQDSYKKKVSNMGMNKKSVFLFNANNGSSVFIDQTNDTKHTIDEYTKLVKGQIHLRVVHDPDQK